MSVFRTCKRIISQFFEINYWYCFRKLIELYPDGDNKYSRPKNRAFHVSKCTWEGCYDILNMMLLKIEHMYYNLKKYGVEADWYMFESFVKECPKKEQKILLQSLIDSFVYYVDDPKKSPKYLEKNKRLRTIDIPFWIAKGHTEDGVEAKLKSFIVNYYDKKWKNIIDTKISFVLTMTQDGAGDKTVRTTEYDFREHALEQLEKILRDLDKKIYEKVSYDFGFESEANILNCLTNANETNTVKITPAVYCQLSNKTKEKCQGNRKKLHDLLILRNYIKRLVRLSDMDDKYTDHWDDSDDKSKNIKDSYELYRKDVKALYSKIFDFMYNNHDKLWD